MSRGFRLSVRRSMKTLLTRPLTSAAGMQATHVLNIHNISQNCNAADLLALQYLGSGTISPSTWRVLFDIASAIDIGPQKNWYNEEQPAYLVLIWAARPRELSIRALDLLSTTTYTPSEMGDLAPSCILSYQTPPIPRLYLQSPTIMNTQRLLPRL